MNALGRKVVFGGIALLALLGGLGACLLWPAAGSVLFSSYATAVSAIVAAVVVGNVGEHFAKKGQP